MKITFKNVGQGDSIIVEWHNEGVSKLAVIDCNIYQGKNPTIEHIKSLNVTEIEFILLSHPHSDHFSGLQELLYFCDSKKIRVKKFLHTSQTNLSFMRSASRSLESDGRLFDLFSYLKQLRNENKIEIYTIDDNPSLVLNLDNEFKLEFLSPSSKEMDNYLKGIKFPFDEEGPQSNPNANWLSTIIKIHNNNYYILLTSDSEESAFKRINKKNQSRLKDQKLFLAQAPHHGSHRNLNKSFWLLKKRQKSTPICVSVGKNSYGHPSKKLLNFFKKTPNYDIFCTSIPSESTDNIENKNSTIDILDLISVDITETFPLPPTSKDLVFELHDEKIIYLND